MKTMKVIGIAKNTMPRRKRNKNCSDISLKNNHVGGNDGKENSSNV